jgi:outer membrane receptor for ferrienterochelin and colicins
LSFPLSICFQRTFFVAFTFALCLCAAAASSFAQTADALRGRVTDIHQAALAGAAVTLSNLSTGLERIAIADANGNYSFTGVRGGRYRLTASASGFATASKIIESIGDQPVDLALEPGGVTEQIVIVSGSRQEELRESLNTKVDVIGRHRIRDTGYESVAEVLQELPGVLARRGSPGTGAAGEQIQGIDSRQVLVLFDGQPVIGARGIKRGVINLDRQSVEALEQIEVVKGASSALYGSDAIGGVINQISREPRYPFEFGWSASGGSQGRFDARGDVGFGSDKLTAFFSGERHKQNDFDLTPATFDTTGAKYERNDAFAKVKYQLASNFALSAFARSYWNTDTGRVRGEEGNQFSSTDEDAQNFNLQADWTASSRVTAQARGYFARWDEITHSRLAAPTLTFPDGRLPDGNLFERYGKVDGSINVLLGEHQLLQTGADWTTDRYRGINRLADDRGNKIGTASFFAQDKISFANRVTLTIGTRFDHHSIFGSAVSPKAGLNVRVTDYWRMRASYGRGFRAPDLGQLFYRFLNPTNLYQVIGNPNLRPEYANSFQLGGEFTSRSRRARLGVNVFYNRVTDLIEAVSLGFIATPSQLQAVAAREGIDLAQFRPALGRLLFYYRNITDAATYGFELDGEVNLAKGFQMGGAYTHLTARDRKAPVPLTGRHKHQGHMRLAWEDQSRTGLRWNLRGTFYSKWIQTLGTTTVNSSGAVTVTPDVIPPGFALWDFYAAKRLWRGLELFGAVDNLTDSQDPNLGRFSPPSAPGAPLSPLPIYRPELGRTYRLGLRFTWAAERK